MPKPSGLNTNFENKSNPAFASEEDTYVVINDKGATHEVTKQIWNDHMRSPKYGWQYLGKKTEQGIVEIEPEKPIEGTGQIGSDKPINVIKGFKKA